MSYQNRLVIHGAFVVALTIAWMAVPGAAYATHVTSDGSIYLEAFTGNTADDAKTNVIGVGATISGEAGQIVTTTPTEGVVRAGTGLGIAAGTEYVLQFDFTINAASGDNFFALFSEGSSSPFSNDIALRVFNDGSGDWEFQVDHEGVPNFTVSNGDYSFGQTLSFTVHHKANVANDIDLYIGHSLFGTFEDRASTLGVNLIQWGDSSGGSGFGDATIDNISIGSPVIIPEPTSLVLAATCMLAMLWRRSNR